MTIAGRIFEHLLFQLVLSYSNPCEVGLACVGSIMKVCTATDAGGGTIDLVYCSCVGAPLGVFATLCADIPSCVNGQAAPVGTCDSVCTNGTASSSCVPDSPGCN